MTDSIVHCRCLYRLLLIAAIAGGGSGRAAAQPGDAAAAPTADSAAAASQDKPKTADQPEPDGGPDSARTPAEAPIPSLQQMLDVALDHNPDVRAAEAQLRVAEAVRDQTRLEVVQKIVAYRDRWQSQRAAIMAAESEARQQGWPREAALKRLALERDKLAELQAELPFLLGGKLSTAGADAATRQTTERADLMRRTMRPVLKRLIEASIAEYNVGRGSLEPIYEASYRLMQVERSLAATEAERIAAIETHRDRMQQVHKETRARFETGTAGQREALMTEMYAVEADLELLDERAND